MPPALYDCRPHTDNGSNEPVTHVTNLAVLSNFFSEQDLGTLAADTILSHPIHATIPNFTLVDHNYNATLAAIDKTEFKLSQAANNSRARAVQFRSMAEYLSHKHLTAEEPYVDAGYFSEMSSYFSNPLNWVTLILSGMAIALAVIVGIKVKMMSLLLLNAKTAAAFPTQLDFFKTAPTVTPPSIMLTAVPTKVHDYDIIIYTLMALVVCFGLASLLYLYVAPQYIAYRRQDLPNCKVCLQLKLSNSQFYIPFMELDSHISCYTFSAPEPLKSIRVVGTLFPRLIIDWPTLSVHHFLHNERIPLPSSVKLTYTQAADLRASLPTSTYPPRPMFYSYRRGQTGPFVVHFTNPLPPARVPIADEELSAEPTAPADDVHRAVENMPLQHARMHLYPVM